MAAVIFTREDVHSRIAMTACYTHSHTHTHIHITRTHTHIHTCTLKHTHAHTHIYTYTHRLKALREDVEKLQSQLNVAERNASSLDAQRKSAITDKAKLAKQVGKYCRKECVI